MLPLGISFCILFINLKKNSRRIVLSVLIFLWFFSSGIIADILWKWVEYPWQRIDESQAPSTEAIVVLSNGGRQRVPGEADIYEWNDPDRFLSGIKLFKENKAKKLIFTGGTTPYESTIKNEGDLYKEYAINLGIPPEAILTTDRVFNTSQEAREIKRILLSQGSYRILLVTSAFHMQRAKKLFERKGFLVHPFPVDFKTKHISEWKNPYKWIPNSSSLAKSSQALREILGRIIYSSW